MSYKPWLRCQNVTPISHLVSKVSGSLPFSLQSLFHEIRYESVSRTVVSLENYSQHQTICKTVEVLLYYWSKMYWNRMVMSLQYLIRCVIHFRRIISFVNQLYWPIVDAIKSFCTVPHGLPRGTRSRGCFAGRTNVCARGASAVARISTLLVLVLVALMVSLVVFSHFFMLCCLHQIGNISP